MLKYKIEDRRQLFSEQIVDEIDGELKDLKFIVFEYLIPRPIFQPIKRISRVYCFNQNQEVGNLGIKYRLFNMLVCWIGLPFGPIEMLTSNKKNKKNKKGIDISEEIKKRLTLADIRKGFLELPLYESAFITVNNNIKEVVEKRLKKNAAVLKFSSLPKLGYIKSSGKHYFYFGFESNDKIDKVFLLDELKKDFNRKTEFILVDLKKSDEVSVKLINEGTELKV